MVVGLPFDLVINREDQKTGSKEEKYIPLLTFCSELSLQQLEELKPFSYEKRRRIALQEDKLNVSEQIFFGSRLIKAVAVEPDWTTARRKAPDPDPGPGMVRKKLRTGCPAAARSRRTAPGSPRPSAPWGKNCRPSTRPCANISTASCAAA